MVCPKVANPLFLCLLGMLSPVVIEINDRKVVRQSLVVGLGQVESGSLEDGGNCWNGFCRFRSWGSDLWWDNEGW